MEKQADEFPPGVADWVLESTHGEIYLSVSYLLAHFSDFDLNLTFLLSCFPAFFHLRGEEGGYFYLRTYSLTKFPIFFPLRKKI